MIRAYKISPLFLFAGFFLLAGLFFVSLPLLLLVASSVLVLSFIRSLFGIKPQKPHNPNVSEVIRNKKIGAYRIKKNPQDPNVIEVID